MLSCVSRRSDVSRQNAPQVMTMMNAVFVLRAVSFIVHLFHERSENNEFNCLTCSSSVGIAADVYCHHTQSKFTSSKRDETRHLARDDVCIQGERKRLLFLNFVLIIDFQTTVPNAPPLLVV